MIGQVRFPWQGEWVVATLTDEGQWSCADPVAQETLESLCSTRDYSPSQGVFGFKVLNDAAELFGGEVISRKEFDPPPKGALL